MLLISLKRAITLVAIRGDGSGGADDRHPIRASAIVADRSEFTEKVYMVFFAMTGTGGDVTRHLIAEPRQEFISFYGERGDGTRQQALERFMARDNLEPVAVEIFDGNIDAVADYGGEQS